MIILLPKEKDGLANLEAKLANVDLLKLDQRTASVKVAVTLPKFKIEQKFSLVNHLKMVRNIYIIFKSCNCNY